MKITNPKIRKALELFKKSDSAMQQVALRATGFKGEVNRDNLICHFDTLDLMDQIDNLILELKDHLKFGTDTPQPTAQINCDNPDRAAAWLAAGCPGISENQIDVDEDGDCINCTQKPCVCAEQSDWLHCKNPG